MPFAPNDAPPKYRGEYPPIWSSPEFYSKFCIKNNFIFHLDDMWAINTVWYVFYKILKFEKKYGKPLSANINNIKLMGKINKALCEKIMDKHKTKQIIG